MEFMEQERAEMVAEVKAHIEKALASMAVDINDSDKYDLWPGPRLLRIRVAPLAVAKPAAPTAAPQPRCRRKLPGTQWAQGLWSATACHSSPGSVGTSTQQTARTPTSISTSAISSLSLRLAPDTSPTRSCRANSSHNIAFASTFSPPPPLQVVVAAGTVTAPWPAPL